jgi:hypothetical protein
MMLRRLADGILAAPCNDFHRLGVRARMARADMEESMKLPGGRFLHLAAGAAALPVVSQIAMAQTYVRDIV